MLSKSKILPPILSFFGTSCQNFRLWPHSQPPPLDCLERIFCQCGQLWVLPFYKILPPGILCWLNLDWKRWQKCAKSKFCPNVGRQCNKSSIRTTSILNISLKLFLQVMASIRNVDAKLSEQIKYLTQVSTGQAHEGSSYPSQKVLQTAWHRYAHSPDLSVVWQK